jgi:hypothetical protein
MKHNICEYRYDVAHAAISLVKGSKCNSTWEMGHDAQYFIEPKAVTTVQKLMGVRVVMQC